MTSYDDAAFAMLLQSVQRLEDKVDALSAKMSERDGERRVATWLLYTGSAGLGMFAGLIGRWLKV